jgi:hypothetical protein
MQAGVDDESSFHLPRAYARWRPEVSGSDVVSVARTNEPSLSPTFGNMAGASTRPTSRPAKARKTAARILYV